MKIVIMQIDTEGDEQGTALVVQSLQAIRTALSLQPPVTNGNGRHIEAVPSPVRQIEAPASEPVAEVSATQEPAEKKSAPETSKKRLCTCGVCRSCKQREAWARRRERGS